LDVSTSDQHPPFVPLCLPRVLHLRVPRSLRTIWS
jgi:hypothetical protein